MKLIILIFNCRIFIGGFDFGIIIEEINISFLIDVIIIILPVDVIEFKTPSIVYRIQVTTKLKKLNILQKFLNNVKQFPREALKEDMIRTLRLRLFVILILIIGAIFYSIYYIISFFI